MRLGALFTRRAVDALAVTLVAFALLEAALGPPKLGHAALALVAMLPLLLHRRFPLVASGVVFAVVAGLAVGTPEAVTEGVSAMLLALLLAFWVAGASAERSHAVAGASIGFASLAVLAQRARADESEVDAFLPGGVVEVGDFYIETAFLFVLAAGLLLAAHALQRRSRRAGLLEERAERLERERGERERAAVVDERRRIARDLHDVVAHSVSVMTVQAGAARLLLAEQPERAREPLLAVEETGRQALGELRRLLGILRREEADATLDPQPGLARLEGLLAQARAAGLPVELSLEGQARTLPAGVDLAAYRIVQEALTNARKHAGPANAQVLVRYAGEALELEVTDDGHTPANGDSSGGHGLVGMRERAALYGGTLHAGPRAQGGYTVHARLPLEAAVASRRPATPPARPASALEAGARGDDAGQTSRVRGHGFTALVLALAVVSEIEIWTASVPGPKAVLVPGVLLWTLPLLWRGKFPFAAPAFAFAAQALSTFAGDAVGGVATAYAALLLTFWVVGAENERHEALAGVAIGFATIALAVHQDVRLDASELVSGMIMGGAVALIAYSLRRRSRRAELLEERAGRLERERGERERAAVVDERRRIARDLHDVVAHSVSVMTVQAGAARLLLAEQPERAREPLLAVEETGRQALAELRRLLGILRRGEAERALTPRPGLARLEELLAETRAAGLPVELSLEGQARALPAGVDLAAYRIVQEALTNVRKHAAQARAHVFVRYRHETLELEVVDDGRTLTNSASGGGHGLVGMRERAALYGGTFQAGPRSRGGYTVHARLPLEATRS